MRAQLMNRRRFTVNATALGLALAMPVVMSTGAAAADVGAGTQQKPGARAVKLPDGTSVSALGQGCSHLSQGRHPPDVEEQALRAGIAAGMTLIDTSGSYGGGRSEQFLAHVIAGQRDRIFLVTKVEANQVSGDGIAQACAASLERLGTSYVDLYLMHFPVDTSAFPGMVAAFDKLRAAGKIRAWGVSNFNVAQLEELFRVPGGARCATNQIPYSLRNRRVERDVLPWCAQRKVPVMAYSPLGGDNNLVINDSTLAQVARNLSCSPAAAALAWVMRSGNVIAIPESGSPAHTSENSAALGITLGARDLQALEAAFPASQAA